MADVRSPKAARAEESAAPRVTRSARAKAIEPALLPRNEVLLTGRVSAAATVRELPSGDELVSWRLIVVREQASTVAGVGGPRRPRSPTVDTIDCVAYRPAVRRAAVKWSGGEILEVRGALRRRFWRGPRGAASRCEVEVSDARKLPGQASLVSVRSGTTA